MIVPVNIPIFEGNEKKYINECIDTGWVSSEGRFVKLFEEEFSSYIGRTHGIAVSNGSAALDIAVAALGIGPGDEVIMPTFTIISPALSVVRAGAIPIFVDCKRDTWNMDAEEIESKISDKTTAIIVVHIYGLPVDMDTILMLCKKYKIRLIEDAAESHGQTYKNKKCGSFGDISTFSFYPNKHITSGEGGMCLTNDLELAERCKKLRNLAFEPSGRRFKHFEMGWNYRMTNMQAAIGLAQLENIEHHLKLKRQIGDKYYEGLKNKTPGFDLPLLSTKYANNIYWVFGLVGKNTQISEELINHLANKHIGTRPFFWCMHEQPVFKKMDWYKNESFPNSEKLSRNGFYIPSGLGISNKEIDYVIESIIDFFRK